MLLILQVVRMNGHSLVTFRLRLLKKGFIGKMIRGRDAREIVSFYQITKLYFN